MTLERGDSPLAGRRPAPLSSVAGLGAMNSLSPIGGMHGPGNMKPRGMPALGSLSGSLNSGTLGSVNGGSLNSLGSNSLGGNPLGGNSLGGNSLGGNSLGGNSLGSNSLSSVGTNSLGSSSLGGNSLGVPRSAQSVNPPVGQPQGVGQTGQVPERNSSAFWLDLQNVERWFDKLDTGERTTLLTSLFYRSPEGQLLQFSSALEMAIRNQPAASSNLSRFGVRHNQTGQDVGSVYTYRPPVSAGGTSSPQGKSVSQNAATRTGSAATPAGSGSAHALGFTGAAPASNTGHDLYNNAFLPLPRSHSYSPWGTEIRRPNSAAADAWPDARGSPLQSASNSGSPNISALSLDTPQASSPSTHSPIGHPLKPWRTFAPHQNTSQHASLQSVQSPIGSAPASVPTVESLAPISSSDANSSGTLRDPNALTATKSDSSGKSDSSSAEPNSSTSPSGSAAGTAVGNVAGSMAGSTAGSAISSNALGQVPKDNRLARRNVDVVDAELLSDIGAWLRSLRLHKYTGNLSGMRWQDVILLSDKDLEDRGVNALGARRKLLKMFEEIRTAQEAGQLPEQSSL